MNEFFENAVYNFSRASGLIKPKMQREEIEDAVVFFAFGVERVFKGIAHDINPMFVYESDSFDNMLSVLYREHLVEPHRTKVEKDASKSPGPNHNLLPFKASMLRAARFSKTVEDNIRASRSYRTIAASWHIGLSLNSTTQGHSDCFNASSSRSFQRFPPR